MFKVFVILVVAVAVCKADFTEAQKKELQEKGDSCQMELKLPRSIDYQQRAQSGDVTSDDPMYKKYVACYMRQLDIVEDSGKIKAQKLINFLAEGHEMRLLKQTVDSCADAVQGQTAEDLAFNFHVCFWTTKNFVI